MKKKANMSNQAKELSNYIYNWIHEFIPKTMGNSSHTVRSYKISLQLYAEYLESCKGITPFNLCQDCFSVSYITDWILWLKENRGLKGQSCNVRVSAIKSLLRYIGGRDISYSALYINAKQIKPVKCAKRKISGMTRNAVRAILSVPDTSTKIGLRDLTLMMLNYGVAARIDEVLSIRLRDLHLDSSTPFVVLHGKGDKTRSIYLQEKLVIWLRKYITVFHKNNIDKSDFLFYSKPNNKHNKLSQPAVSKRLKIYAAKAHEVCDEVPLNLHSHLWRHSMACHWREDNINIVEIKELMGHESLQSTMIYQDVTEKQKLEAIESLGNTITKQMEKKWKSPRVRHLAEAFGINVE